MHHQSFGVTDPGRICTQNQDTILLDDDIGLYILCDGCGGHAAGDVASNMTCDITGEAIRRNYDVLADYADDPTSAKRARAFELIASAIDTASEQVYEAARCDLNKGGMGSTIVLLAVVGNRAIVAHAGDSRGYLLREGQIHQLTEDHNMADQYVKMGLITSQEALTSRYATMITRAVGFHPRARVDTLHFELAPADVLLLCSDGLTRYLSDSELANLCGDALSGEAPVRMISAANDRGGEDNVSAIVVRIPADFPSAGPDVSRRLTTLQQLPLFRHLSFKELLSIMDLADVDSYDAGQRIVAEGDPSDRVFISSSGSVRIVKGGQTLAELPEGSLLGELGLIDHGPRSADIIARGPMRLMVISRRDFFRLLKQDGILATKVLWGLCHVLTGRLRDTDKHLSDTKWDLDQLTPEARPFV